MCRKLIPQKKWYKHPSEHASIVDPQYDNGTFYDNEHLCKLYVNAQQEISGTLIKNA